MMEIKDVNTAPIEDILNRNFRQWKSVPLKDLVIFIDGLDEAPTDEFRKMVDYISEFAKTTPSVNIILSCRKQFYDKLGVREKLDGFELYELYKIQEQERNDYLKRCLIGSIPEFLSEVKKVGVGGLLEHPFYLINLVAEYNRSQEIPNSKIEVIKLFIKKAYDKSIKRRIKHGKIIQDESVKFEKVIGRFALALQLAEVNSFQYEEVQELFETDDIELLQHNSVINVHSNSWSFTNAMFQEYFAALLLSQLPFKQIKQYATVGTEIKKVKEKWVQTISTLLSILKNDAPLFNELFKLVEQDNIELLFLTEATKFDASFKEDLLKKLIQRCIQTKTRITIIYENTIGEFISGVTKTSIFLINALTKQNIPVHIKNVCVRILQSAELAPYLNEKVIKTVLKQVKNSSDPYYAGQLVQLLASHRLGDRILIDELITFHVKEHEYRDDLYDLMVTLNLQDKYYNYAIEGIGVLLLHNKLTKHHGSERTLEIQLLSTNSRMNFWKLFETIKGEQFTNLYLLRTKLQKDFITKLFNKCIELYKTDLLITLPVSSYIEAVGRQYFRSEFNDIDRFLEETSTYTVVVRLLIDKIFSDTNWEIGALVTSECYDYVLFEFEHSNRTLDELRNSLRGLRYKRNDEIFNQFLKLCDDATEGLLFDKSKWNENEEYLKLEKIRNENDQKYIASIEHFQKGVIKYFKAYGKMAIPNNDLYIEATDRFERKKFDSHFIFKFLIDRRRNSGTVRLKACLNWLKQENNFSLFRAEELLNQETKANANSSHIKILEEFYNNELPKANFSNCQWYEDDFYRSKKLESILGDIFKKFEFDTPEDLLIEFIWLDGGGIRSFDEKYTNNPQSISQLVIAKLSPRGIGKLKEKILSNIRNGIKLPNVLGTHLALCRHLKIKQAKNEILQIIQNNHVDQLYLGDTVDIYLELGGSIEKIVDVIKELEDYNQYWYFHLIELISLSHRKIAIESLNKAFSNTNTKEDVKIEAAKYLADLGQLSGFKFLMNLIRINKKSSYSIQQRHLIYNVQTSVALMEIEDLMYLVVDNQNKSEYFPESAKNVLIELLYGFASKSENDLIEAIKFCEKAAFKLSKRGYSNTEEFNFYINRMIENFRTSDKTSKNIFEIKKIFASLPN